MTRKNSFFEYRCSTTVSETRPHIRHRVTMQRSGVGDGGLGGAVRGLRRAAGGRARPPGAGRGPRGATAAAVLLRGGRKSLEPMAARVEPSRVGAAHQSLHHFVAK